MKTQILTFAVVASLFSGCGGDVKMYVGSLEMIWKKNGVQMDKMDDNRKSVLVYQSPGALGLTVDDLAPGPLFFNFTQNHADLNLDPSINDSSREYQGSYTEAMKYSSGKGTASGAYLHLEVAGRATSEVDGDQTVQDITWTYNGYLN